MIETFLLFFNRIKLRPKVLPLRRVEYNIDLQIRNLPNFNITGAKIIELKENEASTRTFNNHP